MKTSCQKAFWVEVSFLVFKILIIRNYIISNFEKQVTLDPTEIFKLKAKEANEKFIKLSKEHKAIATGRVVMFLLSIVLLVLLANIREVWGVVAIILLFPIPFGLLVKHHNKIAYNRDQAKYIRDINENELKIQEGNIKDLTNGEEFVDKSHPYSYDLDVFGRNSLF